MDSYNSETAIMQDDFIDIYQEDNIIIENKYCITNQDCMIEDCNENIEDCS